MELDLFDNAMTSIIHGLEHFATGKSNSTGYKFAILHISQGVELILKERLAREHWVLIYDKVEKPTKSRTIDFETAVERLQAICGVGLDKYIVSLRRLKDVRNDIEHYKVNLSGEEAAVLIGSNIPFLFEFLRDELDTTLQDHVDEGTWLELLDIEQVFAQAINKAKNEKALLCAGQEKDEEYPLVLSCPICGLEFLVVSDKHDKEVECLLCKHISEMKECIRCYSLFPAEDWSAEGDLCPDCTVYVKEPYT